MTWMLMVVVITQAVDIHLSMLCGGRPAPVIVLPPEHPTVPRGSYIGTLRAVTKDSVTVDVYATFYRTYKSDAKGKVYRIEITPLPALPARRFAVGETLASGGIFPRSLGWGAYRLSDLQVGDVVAVYRYDQLNICEQVEILRRPGGRVPPARNEEADARWKWHESRNAWNDFEEKGIPVPETYDPDHPNHKLRRQDPPSIPPAKD